MLKKIIYFSITVLISLVLLEGCYEDLGSYEYETVNQITIDLGNNGFLDQSLSDTLQIDPVLTFSEGSEDDLNYFWYCNDEEIWAEKKIEYPVNLLTGERPYVKFKVVNNRDNSTFVEGFYVDIISEFLTGWVVLTKEGDRSVLSYINPTDYSAYTDFYTLKTGLELGPDAIRVQEHYPYNALAVGSIVVIRNSAEGNIEIDGEALNLLYNTNDFFLSSTLPDDYRCVGEYYMWDYSIILDDNGNLYQRKHDNNTLFQSGVYSNKPMYLGQGVKIDKGWAGPWLSGLTMFYDKMNGALYVGSDFGSVLELSFVNVFPGMPGDYTFIDNMDKELVHIGNIKQGRYSSQYVLIYKDDTSEYWVQNVQLVHNGTYCMAIHSGESNFGSGNISESSVFCQLERKSGYLFFSGGTDNKTLYLYEHTTSKLTEYYTFDSPIKTICADLTNSSNNVLMAGLENGNMEFIGISHEDMMFPEQRFLNEVELGQGVPLSAVFKGGYQYSQY